MKFRISHGNGTLAEMDGQKFRLDPRRALAGEVSMISHAHLDHLPSSFKKASAVCSPITKDFVKLRRNKEIEIESHDSIELLEAGHIAGSNMFLLRGERTVLYTGDFCTREKGHTSPAVPRKCDILIVETTYGLPRYVFPDHNEVLGMAQDWLEDIVSRNHSAVLFAYPLGKAQELVSSFSGLPLAVDPAIAENNQVLNTHGYELSTRELDAHSLRGPVVYITSGSGKNRSSMEPLAKRGARTAAFSGWALESRFMSRSSLDEAFPLSDHCGFDELMRFVEQCDPARVFTLHGFAKEFAAQVRKQLDIPAQPLVARQRTLDHFC